jgi:hypothetical protein
MSRTTLHSLTVAVVLFAALLGRLPEELVIKSMSRELRF